MEVSIKVKGLDSLMGRLDKLDNKLDRVEILEKVANKVKEIAKELCPVDTGRLKRSIDYRIRGHSAEIYTNVHYAPFVEFGTGRRGDGSYPYQNEIDIDLGYGYINGQFAQPYLYPALKLNEEDILKEFKNKLKE